MKKFNFSLQKVLDFKEQVENNIKNEFAIINNHIRREEQKLENLEQHYAEYRGEMEQELRKGCYASKLILLEQFLHNMEQSIDRQKELLAKLEKQREHKRLELVEATTEVATIEKLRERKRLIFDADMLKAEELYIEEFVSNQSAVQKK